MKPHISMCNLDTAEKKQQVRLFQHKYLKLILFVDPFPSLQQLPYTWTHHYVCNWSAHVCR